tara:strand:- start:5011 stop:6825 length:1815 start_codon:yes stop_codon:yes gene_type:complete
MTEPVLSVSGLGAAFRTGAIWHSVIDGISFDIAPRETLAVVGESGSGKSVTAMSVMRLLDRKSSRVTGSVRFGGRELLNLSEAEMCRVRGADMAMIFQEPMTSLNPVRTIGFQIAEALMLHRGLGWRAAENEALQMLERVRIPAAKTRLKDYPHHLSGGMRQRVMIAMALACRPKLLIADEPTTALDVTIQAQILDLIREVQEEFGMSLLFITHDLGVVAEIADRTVVMCRGEQIECRKTRDIFTAPDKPYTRALLAAVPRLGAMRDFTRPALFPTVDRETGETGSTIESPDTVQGNVSPALEVRDLVVRYDIGSGFLSRNRGAVHAVEKVSFQVQPGETLALVGESGCGKSTIGRTIMRLLSPASGDILINGRNVTARTPEAQRALCQDVQMVFQDPFSSLNPRKTVGAAIAAPLKINNAVDTADLTTHVADLLVRVGLDPDMARRYPQEFSGGQRQRICIARSLALNPSVVIADEAVSALDVSIKAQIVNLMLDLQRSMNLAYLFISHDMAVVERVSHRVAVMYMGEIVEIGPRASVLYAPRHAYTRRLLESVPVADPFTAPARQRGENTEIVSPIRAPGYQPPLRQYDQIADGHFVMRTTD